MTIGTTMTIQDKVVPNLVGVDIGCGVEVVKLKEHEINFEQLDNVIHKYIPSGFDVRNKPHQYSSLIDLTELKCYKHVNVERAILSIGTLGGGNHFEELDEDSNRNLYFVVHTGSRNLGKQVAEYYQDKGYKEIVSTNADHTELIKQLKSEGRQQDIQKELEKLHSSKTNKELAYVQGDTFADYIHDMKIVQEFALLNRGAIVEEIVRHMNFHMVNNFTTIHNYIDIDNMILRKGAISAKKWERVIIPMNMRDGSLICIGKGNPDWNYSAPHGAGRLMSRSKAKENISLDEFRTSMDGIYSTSVNTSTIDESPMAYKPMDEIINNIQDTVNIVDIIKPLYNFKSK